MSDWYEYKECGQGCAMTLWGIFRCGGNPEDFAHVHEHPCVVGHQPEWYCHPYRPPTIGHKSVVAEAKDGAER